ncbi:MULTISPECIES: hypothetical protein [unclassified Streptomyces]|uniref:hypothetical protein n=1 Tax=unclassified Streptomyces TaxID=2593676 RepID=UPI002E2E5FAE|nr:hypothetical protein [Streptomyces sp. NBC_00273]
MSYHRPSPTAAQSKRRISRSMMVFASVAFVTGGIALPAAAAIAPQSQTSVTSLPSNGSNPHRQPGGGAYGPDTCKPGYVWREKFKGDTLCVTPAERQRAKNRGRVIDSGTNLVPVYE